MESPTVLTVMLLLLLFRMSVRAATIVVQGIAEIGMWMALAAMGVAMGCQWAAARVRFSLSVHH
jgi:hypothetical protein